MKIRKRVPEHLVIDIRVNSPSFRTRAKRCRELFKGESQTAESDAKSLERLLDPAGREQLGRSSLLPVAEFTFRTLSRRSLRAF